MILGVIPARFASTRFPGKLLADLEGKSILQWTWERASQARKIDKVIIAAGDEQIALAARSFKAEVVELFGDYLSGSDRVMAAVNDSSISHPDPEIVVNIQGDEPLLNPATVDAVIEKLIADPEAGVGTAVSQISSPEEYIDPAVVKVVLDDVQRVMYFSRAPIPYSWDGESCAAFKHIGVYVYRTTVLRKFAAWAECELEKAERLEQLRLIHNGIKIVAEIVEDAGIGVDTEEDLMRLRELLKAQS